MRTVAREQIVETVARLCIEANTLLPAHQKRLLLEAKDKEESELGRTLIEQLIQNFELAGFTSLPICQDCGMAVVFIDIGYDVHLGFDIYNAINEGVSKGYTNGLLRASMLTSCLDRKNTSDNSPAIVHLRQIEGDVIKLTLAPKGGGSENASAIQMLKPADGREGIIKFIVGQVKRNGPSACPPLVLGIGLGGTMEYCAELAKRALLVEKRSEDYGDLELEILTQCNNLGFGTAGLGGTVSVLDVHILGTACHIATLPVAVNISCHAARHVTVLI